MRLGKSLIDIESLHCGRFGFGPGLGGGKVAGVAKQAVGVREAGIGEGVAGITLHSLCKVIGSSLEIGFRPLVPIEEALQVELIGLGILGWPLGMRARFFL